jgi:hypothetical protein
MQVSDLLLDHEQGYQRPPGRPDGQVVLDGYQA